MGLLHPPNLQLCQAFRRETAIVVSTISAADLVMNSHAYEDDPKAIHAKIMQFAASLGVSRQDFPAELRSRLDSWLETGNPTGPAKRKAPPGQEGKDKKKKGEDKKQKRKRS